MNRPVPVRSSRAQPFWEAAAEGRLVIQSCNQCGHLQHYPRAYCLKCLSDDLGWHQCSGLATVYSYTVVRKALNPAFNHLVPYVYALVELDEGVRMTTNIVSVDLESVSVGMKVRVCFEDVGDGMHLPLFTPA